MTNKKLRKWEPERSDTEEEDLPQFRPQSITPPSPDPDGEVSGDHIGLDQLDSSWQANTRSEMTKRSISFSKNTGLVALSVPCTPASISVDTTSCTTTRIVHEVYLHQQQASKSHVREDTLETSVDRTEPYDGRWNFAAYSDDDSEKEGQKEHSMVSRPV
ncbi:hypothetical protein N7492_002455 [Penicillium capsulatum]|uniref:Uncharacterized protein n=1 Tax=Penicillium capsulatum TaxID=69766 RepID=A0A9W9LVP5_9EURO|nr:hypothetical protein N7492_002455 [Penicillium capsulatum]KAJ6122940.1 hypothetical protein N7512_005405 [Penicillium capsulatum]